MAKVGELSFTKDDDFAVDFVCAATNLRCFNFNIAMESKFKIKEMAGKIVPAISSSNGLVGALQVAEAVKILSKQDDQLRITTYKRMDTVKLSSSRTINEAKRTDCGVCSDDSKQIFVASANMPNSKVLL
jgi:ubiquitin-like 1-activating enzyme E1 B